MMLVNHTLPFWALVTYFRGGGGDIAKLRVFFAPFGWLLDGLG